MNKTNILYTIIQDGKYLSSSTLNTKELVFTDLLCKAILLNYPETATMIASEIKNAKVYKLDIRMREVK